MNLASPRWALVAVVLWSCDGLGRPVVDQGRSLEGIARDCTRRAPRCTDIVGGPPSIEAGAPSELPACDLGDDALSARTVTVLRDCVLSFARSAGEEREIVASGLNNVRIELESGVHLRIADSQLFRVTLTGRAPASEPAVVLHVTHTDLRSTRLSADHIEIVSSSLDGVVVEGALLSGVDLETQDSALLANVATLSAARISATHIGDCETLLIAGSRMVNSRVDACEDVTRIYDVDATNCSFDGQLETDLSSFADGRFGVQAFTELHGWGTSIDNTVFCGDTDNIRFSAGGMTCAACQGPLAKRNADVCVDTISSTFEANSCKALVNPEVCDSFPRRPRPIVGP